VARSERDVFILHPAIAAAGGESPMIVVHHPMTKESR